MDFPDFCDGTYQQQSVPANNQRLVNWYRAPMDGDGAATRYALFPAPGVKYITEFSGGGVGRGHAFLNGREFAVIGTGFVEIDASGIMTTRGTVTLDNNPATISSNGDSGDELLITSGGNAYVYDLTANTLSEIASLHGIATMGASLDGYFIVLAASLSTYYISALLDGTTWSAADFFHRTSAPDPWVAMYVVDKYIWLLGEKTSDIHYDAGNSPFPFAPYPVGLLPFGCAAPFSGAVDGSTISWLAQTAQGGYKVVSASGFSPEAISNASLEWELSTYSRVSDAVGDYYTDEGFTHYLLSIPNQRTTRAYTTPGKTWAERGTWDSRQADYLCWLPRFHAWAFGEHRILDSSAPYVWRMSGQYVYDALGYLRRLRRSPILGFENKFLFIRDFELEMEPGQGVANDPGLNPQYILRISRDGGRTWGPEIFRSGGKAGEYGKRAIWRRLGRARRFQIEVAVSDQTPCRVLNASINFDGIADRDAKAAVG